MRIAVTGAGGFLGSEIVKQLSVVPSNDIVAVSGQPAETLIAKWGFGDGQTHREISIFRPEQIVQMPKLLDGVDVVINCAFPRGTDGLNRSYGINFLKELFSAISLMDCKFVNISSQSVYDPQRRYKANESSPVSLYDAYSTAKYSMELLSDSYFRTQQLIQLRLSSLIGPDLKERFINKLVRKAMRQEDITIDVRGSRIYDFMDFRDAASSIIDVAMSLEKGYPPVLNIGSDQADSVENISAQVISLVRTLVGQLEFEFETKVNESHEERFSSALDCSLLQTLHPFVPKKLQDSISDIIMFEADAIQRS